MTEVSENGGAGPQQGGSKGGKGLKLALIAMAVVGALAVLYVIVAASLKPASGEDLTTLARGEMAKLTVSAAPTPAPDTPFIDASGKTVTLKDFQGQVVVLNLWATWCGPCKVEMPTLAKLQAAYAPNKPVRVIALSVDRPDDAADARAFIAQNAPLGFYHDPKFAMAYALQPSAAGLPTTVIFDASGKERARVAGDADWSSADAKAVVDKVLRGG